MIDVFISEDFTEQVDTKLLENAAAATLSFVKTDGDVELTIVVEGDERLQELNLQFLGVDAPTDVLSFPADEMDPDTGLRYLGDIMISFPTANKQAEMAQAAVQDELQLLVIHGTLHLLGFDHPNEEEKKRMWTAQENILKQLGINIAQLPE